MLLVSWRGAENPCQSRGNTVDPSRSANRRDAIQSSSHSSLPLHRCHAGESMAHKLPCQCRHEMNHDHRVGSPNYRRTKTRRNSEQLGNPERDAVTLRQREQLMTTKQFQACIDACQQCIQVCNECLYAMAGKESPNDCPKCCIECVEACEQCVRAMARQSKYLTRYCGICEEICRWCADQCGEHSHDHCQRCAEACRKCADHCGSMAA